MSITASGHAAPRSDEHTGREGRGGLGVTDDASAKRRFLRRVAHGATLLPVALGTLGAVAVGRPDAPRRWWAARSAGRTATTPASTPASASASALTPTAGRPASAARLWAQGLFTLPLGLLSLIPLGIEVLFILRGVFYGLVDDGPYDHSWGGPTRGGAWLAHFAIAVPFAVAGIAALWALDRLSVRLADRLSGRRVGAWPYLAVFAASVGGTMLFIAWLHQI